METDIYQLYNTLLKKNLLKLDEVLHITQDLKRKDKSIRSILQRIDNELYRAETGKWNTNLNIPQSIIDLKDYVLGKAYLISTKQKINGN